MDSTYHDLSKNLSLREFVAAVGGPVAGAGGARVYRGPRQYITLEWLYERGGVYFNRWYHPAQEPRVHDFVPNKTCDGAYMIPYPS